MPSRSHTGFTLVELLVSIFIIGLMLGISVFLAIKDAIASVKDKPHLNAPATPEEVLKAVMR